MMPAASSSNHSDLEPAVRRALIVWAKARALTQENPSLLLKNGKSEECVRRMTALREAEADLVALEGVVPFPPLLVRFCETRVERGCVQCQFGSDLIQPHPDCEQKLFDYFRAEDNLFDFAMTL